MTSGKHRKAFAWARLIVAVLVSVAIGAWLFAVLADRAKWTGSHLAPPLSNRASALSSGLLAYQERPSAQALTKLQREAEQLESSVEETEAREALSRAQDWRFHSGCMAVLCAVWLVIGVHAIWGSARALIRSGRQQG
jgi:cytoskeletal protein RodZ